VPAGSPQGFQLYDYAMFGYFIAYLIYAYHAFFDKRKGVGLTGTIILCLTWVVHTAFLVERTMFYYAQYQGFLLPATNMFEAIGYFCWLVVLLYIIAEFILKTRAFGVFALLLPVSGMAYIARAMTPDPRELMPSLKSYWLVFHVSCMFISYAALFLSFVFALMYLLRSRGVTWISRLDKRFDLKYLDTVSSKLVFLAFPVLTLGVFLGAVWADSAWGRYWGWDPKEVWALITWLIYLSYLHTRIQMRWVGYRSSLLNVIGFAAVLITFQGVNLLDQVFKLNSIHAYAEGEGTFLLTALGIALLIPILMHFLPGPREDITKDEDSFISLQPGGPAPPASGGGKGPENQPDLRPRRSAKPEGFDEH